MAAKINAEFYFNNPQFSDLAPISGNILGKVLKNVTKNRVHTIPMSKSKNGISFAFSKQGP